MDMLFSLLLLLYLTTITSSSPLTITPRATPPKCPTKHLPTFPQYSAAYITFCAHFMPTLSLTPNKPVIYTYILTDSQGNTVPWVLSMTWEQGAFLGGGKMEVSGERCRAWFEAGVKDGVGEWMCGEDRLVKGGRINAVGGEKGVRVWVEARRKRGV